MDGSERIHRGEPPGSGPRKRRNSNGTYSKNVRRATELPSRSASTESDGSLSPMHRLRSPVFSDASDDDLDIYDELMTEFTEVITPDLQRIKNRSVSKRLLDYIHSWKNLYSNHRSKAMDSFKAKDDKIKSLEEQLDNVFGDNASMQEELDFVHTRCEKLENLLQRYKGRQDEAGAPVDPSQQYQTALAKLDEIQNLKDTIENQIEPKLVEPERKASAGALNLGEFEDFEDSLPGNTATPLGDVTVDVDDILIRLSKFSEKSNNLPSRLQASEKMFETYLDSFRESMGGDASGNEALAQLEELLAVLKASYSLLEDDSLIFESRRKISLLSNRLAETSSKLKLRSTEIDDLYMRLEHSEDWNPLAEMIKNFGGENKDKPSLPAGAAGASTGALLFDEVAEQTQSYYSVLERVRKNLDDSKNESSIITRVLGQGMRDILESPSVPRKLKDLTKTITKSIEDSASKLQSVIQDSYESLKDAEQFVHSDQKVIEKLRSQLDARPKPVPSGFSFMEKLNSSIAVCENLKNSLDAISTTDVKNTSDRILFEQSAEHNLAEIRSLKAALQLMKDNASALSVNVNNEVDMKKIEELKKRNKNLVLSLKKAEKESDDMQSALASAREEVEKLRMLLATSDLGKDEEDSIDANEPLDTNRIKDLTKTRLEFVQNVERCKTRSGKSKKQAMQVKDILRDVQKKTRNADSYERLEETIALIDEMSVALGFIHHEMECTEDLTHPDQTSIHELQSLCKELHQRYEVAMTVINGKPLMPISKKRQKLEFSSKETAQSVMTGIQTEVEECRTNISMVSEVMMKALLELGAHLSRADRELQQSIVRQVNTCCQATKSALEGISEEVDIVRTTLDSRTGELEKLKQEVDLSPKRKGSITISEEFDDDDSSSVELPDDLIPKYNFPERSDQYRKVIEDLKSQLEEARGNCAYITDTLSGALDLLTEGHTVTDISDHTSEIEDLCLSISGTLNSMKRELESAGRLLVQNDHLLEQQTHQHEKSALASIKYQRKFEKISERYRRLETKLRSNEVSLKKNLKTTQAILNRRSSQVARLEQSMQLQMNALSNKNEKRTQKMNMTIAAVQAMLVEVESGVAPKNAKILSLLKEVETELSRSSSQLIQSDKDLASLRSNLSAAKEQVEGLSMKVQMTQNDAEAKTNMLVNRFEEEKREMDQKYQSIITQLAEDLEGTKGDTRDIQRSIHNTVENLEQELDDTRTKLLERDLQTEELREFATQKEDRIIKLETMLIDIQGHANIDADEEEDLPESKPIYNLIRAAFSRFSITVQNRLAESEFIDAWAFLGLPGDDDHARSVFKSVDRAEGGLVEYDEFVTAVLGSHSYAKDSMPRIVGTVPEPIPVATPSPSGASSSQVQQDLRTQFNQIMHNATTSPRNQRSILKDLEERMIELEDENADPEDIKYCADLIADLQDNEDDEDLKREAEEYLREDDALDDFTGDSVLKQVTEVVNQLKEAILKNKAKSTRELVTQLEQSLEVVANVLVVQNGWIDELQNRLAIAQDAVQILQKRVQEQAVLQNDPRMDRIDSGVSNLTLGLDGEFGGKQDEDRKNSVNIFQDEELAGSPPVIRGVTPQRAASGNLRQDVLRRQSHQLLQRQYEELVAANKHEQAERVLQQLETLKNNAVIQGSPATVRGAGVDEEDMIKDLEAKDSIISDLHHRMGVAKEMWRDDIEEVKENLLVLEDVVRKKTTTLIGNLKGSPLAEDMSDFRDSLDVQLEKLYKFVQRNRPFPKFLPVKSEESLRYDRDMWREKAMDLAKRGLSVNELGNLPDIPGSPSGFDSVQDVSDFAKQITMTLANAGDHQEAAVTQLAQKIIDMRNNEKKWQHEAFRNQDEYSQLQKELEDMKEDYLTMKSRYETALAMSDVLQECDNPDEIRKQIEMLVKDNQELQEHVSALENELDTVATTGTEQALWKKIATLREQLAEARGSSPSEASKILDAYQPKDAAEMTDIENLKKMVTDYGRRHQDELADVEDQYESQIRDMEANMQDLTQFIEELETDKATIAAACKEKIMEYDKTNAHLEEELDALAADFDEATIQLEQQTEESNLLRQELERVRKEKEELRKDRLRQELDRYDSMRRDFRQERHDKEDQLDDQDRVIMELRETNFNHEAKLEMLETQLKRANKLNKNAQEVLAEENQELQTQLDQAKKSKVELINQYAAEMSRLTGLTRQLQRQLAIQKNESGMSQWVENWRKWVTH